MKSEIQKLIDSGHLNSVTLKLPGDDDDCYLEVRLHKDDSMYFDLDLPEHRTDTFIYLDEDGQDQLIEFLILQRRNRNNFHGYTNSDLEFEIVRKK